MITIAGILINPINEPIKDTTIRITSEVTNVTILSMIGETLTDKITGAYSFQLVEGIHKVEILISAEYTLSGTVEVTDTDVGTFDLPTLLTDFEYIVV